MAFDFSVFGDGGPDEAFVEYLLQEQGMDQVLHYERLWQYYRNEMREVALDGSWRDGANESARPYRQSQEYGLPSRITGTRYGFYGGTLSGREAEGVRRKEVVVENDISWRIDAMVDFLFGKRVGIHSRAADAGRAEQIERVLSAVLDANGGASYLQELALLGSVYGFVDVIVRWRGGNGGEDGVDLAGRQPRSFEAVLQAVRDVMLEAIEAPRSLPILDEQDYRTMRYYVQHFWQRHNVLADSEGPLRTTNGRGRLTSRQRETHNVEVLGPDAWQRYEDAVLVGEGVNPLGVVPVVHIQNMPLPLRYEGQSDVEPLIPLQDELNTRLSDRANRITFQSFKMYLGKGIEGFEERVISPGRMWATENPEARIEEFGGDAGSPSELEHIGSIRESLDKASGVASVAAGILKGRIGNLTSAVALKVTLMGVLAKTERKRRSYGKGLGDMCRMILLLLDKTGVFPTEPAEREIEIHWPSPLPENLMEKLQEAKLKRELGVPAEAVLRELGYGETVGQS